MDNRDHESNLQSEINNLQFRHTPVLLSEVIAGLAPRSGGRYVDGTLGGGGHALAILAASSPKGRLLGIDADPSALAAASTRLAIYGERATLVHGNFRDLGRLVREHGFAQIDGLVLDLGVSSHQLDTPARGFSFASAAPHGSSPRRAANDRLPPRANLPIWWRARWAGGAARFIQRRVHFKHCGSPSIANWKAWSWRCRRRWSYWRRAAESR